LTDPDHPTEELPAKAVSQLNDSLKSCHKVVDDYRAALLNTPASPPKPPERD
jgi:hypothetical protein